MKATIFYSWQSDIRAAANRTLIQDALEGAVKDLHAEGSLTVEPVVDRDTQAVPGSPDIDKTILDKIDASGCHDHKPRRGREAHAEPERVGRVGLRVKGTRLPKSHPRAKPRLRKTRGPSF